jgi:hypothetical protein
MRYKFDIHLTEEDYLDFELFHCTGSSYGKKQLRKSNLIFIGICAAATGAVILLRGWGTASFATAILMAIYLTVRTLFSRRLVKRNIQKYIRRTKQTGSLPIDFDSSFEFFEDHMVETTPSKRIEQAYSSLERICVIKDRYILLYTSSSSCHILSIPQIRDRSDLPGLIDFLSQKCHVVEFYDKI